MSAHTSLNNNVKANSSLLGVLCYARQLQAQMTWSTIALALGAGVMVGMLTSQQSPLTALLNASDEPLVTAHPVTLSPTFLVRVSGDDGLTHHAMIDMVLMMNDTALFPAIARHEIAIRRNLTDLIQSTSYNELSSMEGKKRLREQAKTQVNALITQGSDHDAVDTVLFTNYLVE